jgi:hypothetical protein
MVSERVGMEHLIVLTAMTGANRGHPRDGLETSSQFRNLSSQRSENFEGSMTGANRGNPRDGLETSSQFRNLSSQRSENFEVNLNFNFSKPRSKFVISYLL